MTGDSNPKTQLSASKAWKLNIGLWLLAALLLGACQAVTPAAAPANTPVPTNTRVAAPTDTLAPTDTPVPAPSETPAPTDTPIPTAKLEPTPTEAMTQPSVAVKLVNFSFAPATVTIKAGTTVVWTSEDQVSHTVTADDGSFDSGTMRGGDTFSHTFTEPGEYPYYCRFHGGPGGVGMAGTIVVTK
jgi:plastocyanin